MRDKLDVLIKMLETETEVSMPVEEPMENIIFNELRYRGFSVDIGVVEVREKTPDSK